MSSGDKALTIIVVVLIVTLGGCMGNALHQEEKTKQYELQYGDCKG